jgi:formiminotetrahydrofolate cyclodeaminase
MTDSLWELSLRDALTATAGPSATPGGGSNAPVTSAFGLGLVVMALEVTQAKQPSEALANAIARGRALLSTLAGHADRDVLVFATYMQALGLPKADAAQQAARSAALQAAVLGATEAPLTAAEACVEGLRYSEAIASLVQRNVWSDLLAGADLMFGSLKAVLRSVDINLPAVRDEAARNTFADRARAIAAEASAVYARLEGAEKK